jgi:hypothetical protein
MKGFVMKKVDMLAAMFRALIVDGLRPSMLVEALAIAVDDGEALFDGGWIITEEQFAVLYDGLDSCFYALCEMEHSSDNIDENTN